MTEDALRQARDRMETAWNLIHPGDLTDDEVHGIAQNLWYGMEELNAALGQPSYFNGWQAVDVDPLRPASTDREPYLLREIAPSWKRGVPCLRAAPADPVTDAIWFALGLALGLPIGVILWTVLGPLDRWLDEHER